MLTATCHVASKGWVGVDDLATISDLRAKADNIVWAEAEVRDLPESEIRLIAEEFDLDPHAVEDAKGMKERPRIEKFRTHHLVVWHELNEENDQLEAKQISWFLGSDYVLALHDGANRVLSEARNRWTKDDSGLRHGGSGYLLWTLVDTLVDDYGRIADRLELEVEDLEDVVLREVRSGERSRRLEDRGDEPRGIDSELYGLKQQLSRLRRYVLPGDQLLRAALAGDDALSVSKSERKLFRDVLDHLDRIGDQVHSIGDLVDAAIDLRRSTQTATLSEVNKKLTAWAAIIAVPTLISSTYGMNFSLVPEDQTLLGFWFALALMAVSATTLFVFFKRRGWL